MVNLAGRLLVKGGDGLSDLGNDSPNAIFGNALVVFFYLVKIVLQVSPITILHQDVDFGVGFVLNFIVILHDVIMLNVLQDIDLSHDLLFFLL